MLVLLMPYTLKTISCSFLTKIYLHYIKIVGFGKNQTLVLIFHIVGNVFSISISSPG